MWQAIACLTSNLVLWIYLDDLGASEFRGGWLTRPLFSMADLGSTLLLLALLLTLFLRRIAGTMALPGALLCLPLYLYFLMPGPYEWIFDGISSVPSSFHPVFSWNNWAVVGVLSLFFAAFLSLRSFRKVRAGV